METTFVIIDDDVSVCKILEQIIRKNNLGRIVSILNSGIDAEKNILSINPDILLIDLLLPEVDGIEIVKKSNVNFRGKTIMISQVEDAQMISDAYRSGIYFYISKPINLIETISVIKNVKNQIKLEKSMSVIKNVVFTGNNLELPTNDAVEQSAEEKIKNIFLDIGIAGTSGSEELQMVILNIIEKRKFSENKQYVLKEIYIEVCREIYGSILASINSKSMEQRLRRAIYKGMNTVASLGIDDSDNYIYIEYASSLFDINQIKQEINHIKNNNYECGKINTKKFIEGILSKI